MIRLDKTQQMQVDTAKRLLEKYPGLTTNSFLCHIPADQTFSTAFGKGKGEYWDIYTPETRGYKIADNKYPIFHQQDLKQMLDAEADESVQLDYFKAMRELEG